MCVCVYMCMCSLIMAHVWRSVLCSTMGVEGTELRLSGLVASDYPLASLKQLTLPLTWQEFIQDHCFEDRSLWWGIGASSHQSFPTDIELGLYQHTVGPSLWNTGEIQGLWISFPLDSDHPVCIFHLLFHHYHFFSFCLQSLFFSGTVSLALIVPWPLHICFTNLLPSLFIFSFKSLLSWESFLFFFLFTFKEGLM